MKKLILAVSLMACSLTFAQPGTKEKMTPEQRVEKQLKEMTNDLGLNEKQQGELKVLLTEQSKKREAKRLAMKASREKGETVSDEKRAEMRKDMIDEQLEMKTKMKKILTEEQMKKLKEMRMEKGKAMKDKRKAAKKAE